MTTKEYITIKDNAEFINTIGNNDLESSTKRNMEDNLKSALIGGGIGVLIAIATRRNLMVYGIGGLIIGRFLLKVQ